MLNGLGIGRIVHYVLSDRELHHSQLHCVGQIIPAIVVAVDEKSEQGVCNLQGFTDSHRQCLQQLILLIDRPYSEISTPGTWHWPPR